MQLGAGARHGPSSATVNTISESSRVKFTICMEFIITIVRIALAVILGGLGVWLVISGAVL